MGQLDMRSHSDITFSIFGDPYALNYEWVIENRYHIQTTSTAVAQAYHINVQKKALWLNFPCEECRTEGFLEIFLLLCVPDGSL